MLLSRHFGQLPVYHMQKNRLEAFSDGVIAIIITIMVLEMKPPHNASPAALLPVLPIFLSYVLSFVYVGIYWNNHHHLIHAVKKVDGLILWANLHLLFWLSLLPFTTAWAGENHFATYPCLLYGINLLMAAIAYWALEICILRLVNEHLLLKQALGKDHKGKLSILLYAIAITLACYLPLIALGIYVLVALIWLIPDRRIERALALAEAKPEQK